MLKLPVYMDNHATTRVDPRVLEAMWPWFSEKYGNAGSINHGFGDEAREAVEAAREHVATALGTTARQIVFTSGATESNNLAIRGVCERSRLRGNHLVSVTTEHKSVLEPLARLGRRDFEVTLLEPAAQGSPCPGRIDPQQVADALRDDTVLVSIMWANNEIGVLQSIAEIAAICHQRGVAVHCDATQAVGKVVLNVEAADVDLLSFSAHKLYGPKGVGGLYVRRRPPSVRIEPQIEGGGQEHGLRSGTLNVPGIVGLAQALDLCVAEIATEARRLESLRNRLFAGLQAELDEVTLNGPPLDRPDTRLPGNLNCSFAYVDGEALMMSIRDLAVSSGAACTSANPEPSHVLRAIGVSEDLTRASLRFGLGRFTTAEEVEFAIQAVAETVKKLRRMSSMA